MRTTSRFGSRRRSALALVAAALVAVGAAGCGSSDSSSAAQPSPSVSASAAAGVLTVRDPWVKAADKGLELLHRIKYGPAYAGPRAHALQPFRPARTRPRNRPPVSARRNDPSSAAGICHRGTGP